MKLNVCQHSLYVDKFTRLFYLVIQLVRVANKGRWCRWWLQSNPWRWSILGWNIQG